MADPVKAIVKKLLPGVRNKPVEAGTNYWHKTVVCSKKVNPETGTTPEYDQVKALWKALCAAFTGELGKPTVKKSMSYSWDGVRCWYYGASAGHTGRAEWAVGVESTRKS